ncbi:pilus assembly protein [Thioalkalivibrio sp. AKL6]|uniref:pilus assembly protein n=1 Tax=Thioalkalivibrio sp. AKL6 TaxID=1158154 RepID=UPI000476E52D|nr:PilC/PilY family type IV pilus protein [Thioalkalivibrio sp. AKL6]
MSYRHKTLNKLASAGLALALTSFGAAAQASVSIAQSPVLLAGTNVPPNVMMLFDTSGSMLNIVEDKPYDPNENIFCSAGTTLEYSGSSDQIDILIDGTTVQIEQQNSNYLWGIEACFDSDQTYNARLHADMDADDGTRVPGNYLPASYSGHYLNWYFDTFESGERHNSLTETRLEVARAAAAAIVETTNNVRMGLARYSDEPDDSADTYLPAHILVGIDDIDQTRTALLNKIQGLPANALTPLAESLHSLGRYFVQGHNNKLTLHPDGGPFEPSTHNAYDIFNIEPTYEPGVSSNSPIEQFCQASFIVTMTDGRPQADRALSTHNIPQYIDYDGDCTGTGANCDTFDRKPHQSYESLGSDYLDDIAMALFDIDLRPDLTDFDGEPVKNNIRSYLIGFGEDDVLNDPLLQDTVDQGGGEFFAARNASELAGAFRDALGQVLDVGRASGAAITANSTRLDAGTRIYQALFDSTDWTGDLISLVINESDGSVDDQEWSAAEQMPVHQDRRIFTFDPDAANGIAFQWGALTPDQKEALAENDATLGQQRLEFLRGDQSNELNQDGGSFRVRSRILGDIINSDPAFMGEQDFGYQRLPSEDEADHYGPFLVETKRGRTPVLFVGANDGMLHAFNAETGTELFAYVPDAVFPYLEQLTRPGYNHRFFVDGAPRVVDAYLPERGGWRSILVGSTGAFEGQTGSKGAIFALDVTDPENFDANDVMWEFTHDELGVAIGQPAIARLPDGNWVALFGNGYNSVSHQAQLFMVNLADGSLHRRINTERGGDEDEDNSNGLATPVPVDLNGDRVTDRIYAGDRLGNLWAFDTNNQDNWRSAYRSGQTPLPLFTAAAPDGRTQPITVRPEVGRHPDGGQMVFFGTGQFYETGANLVPSDPSIQTFYGIRDDNGNSPVGSRDNLQQQTIEFEGSASQDSTADYRIYSDNQVSYSTRSGWYLDLKSPVEGPNGERVISRAVLRDDRIIFVSVTPSATPCSTGGFSWLNELDAINGSRLDYAVFDIDGDGSFDAGDRISIPGTDGEMAHGGGRRINDLVTSPFVMDTGGEVEHKYLSGASGEITTIDEAASGVEMGRQSWEQIR